MGSKFKCPHCGVFLRKTPMDAAMGNLGGFVLSGGSRTEKCPACGVSIDRLEIINGKYDAKEWWQFWK